MRSTPLTSCSMGVATDCSTASADAPGYVAVARMLGGARNGYCSIESPRITTTPIKSVRIEITIATIGRPIKKLAMDHQLPYIDINSSTTGASRSMDFHLKD